MAAITLQTTRRATPMIYAYSTPGVTYHEGWTKIGYTERDVIERLKEQTNTAGIKYQVEWRGNAMYDDGSGETFHDTDFHAYLQKLNIEKEKDKEWFRVTGDESRKHFYDFRANRGRAQLPDAVIAYQLRAEQEDAVQKTKAYYETHKGGEFLWNAKPRFGKTLSVYDFCKQIGAETVLIVTNRPAIANSWHSDYVRFLGKESRYLFVSRVEALVGKPYVLSEQQYSEAVSMPNAEYNRIEFVSLQDLKDSSYFGGKINKLEQVANIDWDLLVIDEAHEGVDTYKTDLAFTYIKRKFTLHLSGTPFKALASDKFPADAIYNWTYADEQRAKRDWKGDITTENPYENLPRLNLFTYQMSEIIREELDKGVEIQGETVEYAFDLNEFFLVKANGEFVRDGAVNRFLDALTTQNKFPFSTEELRRELKHTFWLLNRVESARSLAKKLKAHPVFSQYEIILAAGDGKLDDAAETAKAYDRVKKAISDYDRTITLSVGQLTTGVTIPEWSAVLMLSGIKSPALYMQAAFRSQNPCLFKENGEFRRKENAYVFDFDPARTLEKFEEFANDLSADTADGRGDAGKRKERVKELLNFFPVIGEDEGGEMVELDAEQVLSIPRKIKSLEVVRRGFMSDFLFQNISNVFHAPPEVFEIIQKFQPVTEQKDKPFMTSETRDELSLDENGDVALSDGYVIGRSSEVFGDKIFAEVPDSVYDVLDDLSEPEGEKPLAELKKSIHETVLKPIIEKAKEEYGRDLRPSDQKRFESRAKEEADVAVSKVFDVYRIEQNTLETQRRKQLDSCKTETEQAEVNRQFDEKLHKASEAVKDDLLIAIDKARQAAQRDIVQTVETSKKEQEKKGYEDTVRNHLRGFSRTIPSFLMAYGDENVTLANFDKIIPDHVFFEVTSITLEQFRFLRDGGPYINQTTGAQEMFTGKLFDPVVFDDSVKEFLRLKENLADYFSEENAEDIFDYIPPQKTNQIFTPKWVVKKMVDLLAEENPGCFDDPAKTFLDPYMKSGLYITEIVKRLYQSEEMKRLFPDEKARLTHIFEKQVYGLAPTEIIYRIATSYILGFAQKHGIEKHNLRHVDALEYAKNGTLEEKLTEIYS